MVICSFEGAEKRCPDNNVPTLMWIVLEGNDRQSIVSFMRCEDDHNIAELSFSLELEPPYLHQWQCVVVIQNQTDLQSLIEAPTPSPSLDSSTCFASLSSLLASWAQLTYVLWPQLTPYVKPLIRHSKPEHTTVTVTHTCTLNMQTCENSVDEKGLEDNKPGLVWTMGRPPCLFIVGLSKTCLVPDKLGHMHVHMFWWFLMLW